MIKQNFNILLPLTLLLGVILYFRGIKIDNLLSIEKNKVINRRKRPKKYVNSRKFKPNNNNSNRVFQAYYNNY